MRESCRMISEAFDDATCRGRAVVLSVDNALERSLSQMILLHTCLNDNLKRQKRKESMWRKWFREGAHVKEAEKEIERIDLSELRLDSSSQLTEDLRETTAAYEKVMKLCDKHCERIKCSSRALKGFAAILDFVRAVLPALPGAAAILQCELPDAAAAGLKCAGAPAVDTALKKLIDCLQSKIETLSKKQEEMQNAHRTARNLRADMGDMQLKVAQLHGELCITASRVCDLHALLNEQELAEIAEQLERLRQIKAFCSSLMNRVDSATMLI